MDTLLRDAIADDLAIFDASFTGTVEHNEKAPAPNLDTGTTTTSIVSYTLDNCIFRNAALRNDTAIKQLHQRDVSIQVDSFDSFDRVVEVPIPDEIYELSPGDSFIDETGKKWRVIAIDLCTLGTRYRLGLKVFA